MKMRLSTTPHAFFDITEEPVPLSGWSSMEDVSYQEVIAHDIQEYMVKLAMVDFQYAQEKENTQKDKSKLLLSILEVKDSFERVFLSINKKQESVTPQMKKWIGNFRTVYRLIDNILDKEGVVRIEALERDFKPGFHVVVKSIPHSSLQDETIVEELRSGYMWQNEILRKAEVVVVNNSLSTEDDSTDEEDSFSNEREDE